MQTNRRPNETKTNTIRRLSPSIKDLLPVFDYLRDDQTNNLIAENSLNQRNLILKTFNDDFLTVNDKITALGGNNINTLKELKVKPRNWLQTSLGLWEDGVPTELVKANEGDGTVLNTSANGPFSQYFEQTLSHGDLVMQRSGIEAIFDQLGLEKSDISQTSFMPNPNKVLIALLQSPGIVSITNDSGIPLPQTISIPEAKMILVPGITDGNYQVKVDAGGETGNYVLQIGLINDGKVSWQSFGANTFPDDEDIYPITVIDDETRVEVDDPLLDLDEILLIDINSLEAKINLWDGALSNRGEKYIAQLKQAVTERKLNRAKEIVWWLEYLSISFDKEAEQIICERLLNQLMNLTLNQTPNSNLWSMLKTQTEAYQGETKTWLENRGFGLAPAQNYQKATKMMTTERFFDAYEYLLQSRRF